MPCAVLLTTAGLALVMAVTVFAAPKALLNSNAMQQPLSVAL